jgi:hypothetical protein
MSTNTTRNIEIIRDLGADAPRVFVLATGAGAGIQSRLWALPGCSNFLIGAGFPYEPEDTARHLGFTPEKYCDENIALDLAMTAYLRAVKSGSKAIGIGLAASVASTREHRGDHRIFVAAFGDGGCYVASAVIPKGVGWEQRGVDGLIADSMGLNILSRAMGLQVDPYILGVKFEPIEAMDKARARLFAHPYFKANGKRGTAADIDPLKTLIYPGSFNPFHDGHDKGGQEALFMAYKYHQTLVHMTTINPVHKATLSVPELMQRVAGMQGRNYLLSENDPLFLDKARAFPGAAFVLGADTLATMLDPKWGIEIAPLLEEFSALSTRFYVLGRLVKGEYKTSGDIIYGNKDVDDSLDFLFKDVPGRWDISSTELRNKEKK